MKLCTSHISYKNGAMAFRDRIMVAYVYMRDKFIRRRRKDDDNNNNNNNNNNNEDAYGELLGT
jgi:hypothetical protein